MGSFTLRSATRKNDSSHVLSISDETALRLRNQPVHHVQILVSDLRLRLLRCLLVATQYIRLRAHGLLLRERQLEVCQHDPLRRGLEEVLVDRLRGPDALPFRFRRVELLEERLQVAAQTGRTPSSAAAGVVSNHSGDRR